MALAIVQERAKQCRGFSPRESGRFNAPYKAVKTYEFISPLKRAVLGWKILYTMAEAIA